MFWWIFGSGIGIAALGAWRMAAQGKAADSAGAVPVENVCGNETPETLESIMLRRLERRMAGMEEKLDAVMAAVGSGANGAAGGVAGTGAGSGSRERDKPVSDQYLTQLDQIVKLSERGTAVEAIAKKMNMHKGEVQLLLNLSRKSS
ncbi:hypothetical protein [Acidaminobacter hydrogenoformans]|uniref:DUF2802 domain-containing protein n=1 Tax=Acidaminobacter hydrogenoformans DSM 2784 TaxID=1120920 RepID=A0A1G5RV26_9FIRM|nr:hypothetical protein [Acidaminobacter hydrogenoformans]SCZ77757.1 hypothetical protein SAMN03080599_00933 [Acidaminobacter hydrogenoformans DSM 2784]